MKYLIPLFIFLFVSSLSFGQQEAVRTHYFLNPGWISPAYAGFDGNHNLYGNYRNKWSAFEGAPRNFALNYHGPATDRVGLGIIIANESIGSLDQVNVSASFAYQFGNEDWKMSLGVAPGYEKYSLNGNVLEGGLDPNDPIVTRAIDGVEFFNLGAGIYGEYQNTIFAALTLPQMIRARVDEVTFDQEEDNKFLEQFTLLLGYRIDVEGYDIKLEPSIFMKRLDPDNGLRNVDFQVDANLKASFLNEQLIGGLTYSVGSGDRLGFLIGTKLNSLRFYYGYDVSFQKFQDYTSGSHEITLGFQWPKRLKEEKVME